MTLEEVRSKTAQRNRDVCAYYASGHTMADTARHFALSRQRIQQILRAGGAWRPHEKSGRDQFIGVVVKQETKDALREKATKRGVSVSKLASDVLDAVVK